MEVIVESRNPEVSALRSVAENRLRFVLRRLAWRVPRAKVKLDDTNGPRGGVDKEVRVELQMIGAEPVVVSARSRDWRGALDAALSRAAQRLVRAVRRARQQPMARTLKYQTE